jgi:hypothetical protein
MTRFVLAVLVCVFGSVPVLAQSSLLDFSKPMTGKSRFGINPDGSPLELGVPARRVPSREARSSAPAVACDGGSCGSAAERSAPPETDGQSGKNDQSANDGQSEKDDQSGKRDCAPESSSCEQTKTPASQGEAGEVVEDQSSDQ